MEKKNRAANSARMTSIVRKIHWQWIRKKLGMNLGFDLVLFLLLSAGWAVTTEYAALGGLILRKGVKRALFGVRGLRHMTYRILESDGTVLLKTDAFYPMLVISGIVLAFLILQLLGMILAYYREDRQIRRALAPINEIALKADEISRSMISGDQYQRIEEAIAHLEPGEAQMKLSFGDEDLTGIETAVNNLIFRMRDAYR
ncbi:MAG: sensor histidine kinase, partial [Lachnospiraceae bacterium]|nr:sensor histidine kinase [Lachnospiraceae bacterium]